MTENQRKYFYFPAWLACARANDWRMVGGRLLADLPAQLEKCNALPEPAAGVLFDVIHKAMALAAQDHCAVTADHLRHACNAIAGGNSSSGKLNNGQLSKTVNLFNLLAEPENLTCVMHWLNPEEADRVSLADHIGRLAHEAQLRAISVNAWNTSEWRDQSIDRLRWLLREVKHENKTVKRQLSGGATAGDGSASHPYHHGHHTTPF